MLQFIIERRRVVYNFHLAQIQFPTSNFTDGWKHLEPKTSIFLNQFKKSKLNVRHNAVYLSLSILSVY